MKKYSLQSGKKCGRNQRKYNVIYTQSFYDDLNLIVEYIAFNLCNQDAAIRFMDSVEAAIEKRKPFADSFERVQTLFPHKHDYYRIYVGNYVIYYVVISNETEERVMEVRRILYKKQEL